MILDHVPQYNKVSGSEKNYELLRLFVYDEHDVAWTKCTWVTTSNDVLTTHLLICECDFTEGIGWHIGTDDCFYETPNRARICSYRQAAIQQRYQELRELCALSENPSADEIEHAMRILIAIASENRMFGDEYESSYFSLQTFLAITCVTPEQALEAADRVYQTKTACFDGRDMVTYDEPMWLLYQEAIVTTAIESDVPEAPSVSAVLTLYKPLHGHMPPKWRCELRYSDRQDSPLVRHIWIQHFNQFSEKALTQGQLNDKFMQFRKQLAGMTSKIDSLQSF